MPVVIPAIVGGATSYFVGGLFGGGLLGSVIGGLAGGIVSNVLGQAIGGDEGAQASPFQSQASAALVNTASNDSFVPVVYGFRRVGGARVFTQTYGDTNEGLCVALVLSEGEVSSIGGIYLDDIDSGADRYAGGFQCNRYVGTDSQSADTPFMNASAKWTTAHRLRGFAYIAAQFTWYEDRFANGLPVMTANVSGRLVYDPRDATTKYSNNPALCIRDYLTNTRYGCRIPQSVIDDDTFTDAANHCDESVNYPVSGSPSFAGHARYTLDGIVDTGRAPLENLNAMLSCCRGMLIYSGGVFKLVIDKAEAASGFEFNEDNIIGAWSIRLGGKRDRLNRVKAHWFNPNKNWQPDVMIYDSSSARTSDNSLLLEREIELPYTTNPHRASRIAMIEQKQSRFSDVIEFTATVAALQVEVGDVVSVTHSLPGYSGKLFRVLRMELLNSDEVKVTARAYSAAVYTADSLTEEETVTGVDLPDPFADLDISTVTASSGTSDLFVQGDGTVVPRIRLRWAHPGNAFLSHYEIQFARTTGSPTEWVDAPDVGPLVLEGFAHPVADGVTYDVRVRAVTSLGNAGAWAYVRGHSVIGKTAAPSNVTGASAVQQGNVVVFDCDTVADADLDLVAIRVVPQGSSTWADGTPLTNILRGQTATSAAVPPGDWTFLFKAVDTSGNESSSAASVDLTVTSTGFTSIMTSEQAPRWLGEKANLVAHYTGVLVPDSQNLASADGWETFDEFVTNAYADCYYTAPEMDKSISAPGRIWAGVTSALGPGESSGVSNPRLEVDYRGASYDGFESWTIGTATFRYLSARLHIDTSTGKPVLSGFEVNVDAAARTEEFSSQAIDAGGTAITFSQQFHSVPVIQMTPVGASAAIPSAESPTTTGFTARLFNTSGSGISGTANITVTGA